MDVASALRRSVVTGQPKDAKFEQLFDKNKTVTIIVTKRNEVFRPAVLIYVNK